MLAILLFSLLAYAEKETGNGGDSYAQDFVYYGKEAIRLLKSNPIPEIDTRRLEQAVKETLVSSEDRLRLNGNEVDAINYPSERKIVINRNRWKDLASDEYKKIFLTLHEYLYMIGVEDVNYIVSNKIDRGDVCNRSYGMRITLEYKLEKLCYEITKQDLENLSDQFSLSGGLAKNFEKGDFRYFTNLKRLYIYNSATSTLEKEAFEGLDSLERLFISFNNVVNIESSFYNLKNIKHLSLNFSDGQTLTGKNLEGLPQTLEYFSVNNPSDDTYLHSIPLDYIYNKLIITDDAFENISSVEFLTLVGDINFNGSILKSFKDLHTLALATNKINKNWFANSPFILKSLWLVDVGSFSQDDFIYAPQIQNIYIFKFFSDFPNDLFQPFNKLFNDGSTMIQLYRNMDWKFIKKLRKTYPHISFGFI